jgi:hypothetical protein
MARDRVRDEAERLVAAAITAVSLAARGMGAAGRGSNFATGSPECCVCPVCRVIATMRDPSADLADRLAAGAGDLATGVASMLRALARTTGHPDADDRERTREGDEFWESLRRRASAEATAWRDRGQAESEMDSADPWRAATTAPAKPMAKKAVKKTVAKKAASSPRAAERPEPAPGPEPTGASAPAAKKVAKKAAKAAPAKAVPTKKATVAKKTTNKAVPPPADFG